MGKQTTTEVKVILVVASLLFAGHLLDKQNRQELKDTNESIKNNFTTPPSGARNLDYSTGEWVMQGNNKTTVKEVVIHQDKFDEILSDEEIRILREKQSYKPGGSYIYTPGRNVPSYKKLHEKAIEDYLDKHGEELYDELNDKYGN